MTSLVMNVWAADERATTERLKDPMLLDMGWATFPCLSVVGDYQSEMVSSTHLVVKDHRRLGQKGKKRKVCIIFTS